MACGLSYGELLPLCTIISLGLVAHGIRVTPQTFGVKDAELQVAEPEAKGVHLIQKAQGFCNAGLWLNYTADYKPVSDQYLDFYPPNGQVPGYLVCACACFNERPECRAFTIEGDKCVLYWRNHAGFEFLYTSGVQYWELEEVSGTEDFEGPFVNKKMAEYNKSFSLNRAYQCAQKCRDDAGCQSFSFEKDQRVCHLSGQRRDTAGVSYGTSAQWNYYERRVQLDSTYLGPFVGTFLYAEHPNTGPNGYLQYYDTVGSDSACLEKCQDNVDCKGFNWNHRLNEGYRCYLNRKNRAEVESRGSNADYAVSVAWNYYERM